MIATRLGAWIFYTGGRWGELSGQQRHEYDEQKKAIGIRAPLKEVGGTLKKHGKAVAESDAPVPAPSSRRRRGAAARRGRTKIPAGTRWVELAPGIAEFYEMLIASHAHPFVFSTPEGHPWRRSNFRQRYWRPAWDGRNVDNPDADGHEPAILPWLTFHEGRHTHATWLTEDGVPEVARRARLGQKMKGIARIYDHVTDVMRKQILDAVEARWEASLLALTATERARLTSWFPHLGPVIGKLMIENEHGTKDAVSHTRLKPHSSREGTRLLTSEKMLVGDTGIEPVTPTVSRLCDQAFDLRVFVFAQFSPSSFAPFRPVVLG